MDAEATPRPLKSLIEGRIDLAIMSDPVRDRRLAQWPLFEDELLLIMSPNHRLAGRAVVEPEDLAEETLIIYPPREESTVLQQVLAPAGVVPKAVQQVQLSEAILELVKAGLGVAAMARWAIEPSIRAGTASHGTSHAPWLPAQVERGDAAGHGRHPLREGFHRSDRSPVAGQRDVTGRGSSAPRPRVRPASRAAPARRHATAASRSARRTPGASRRQRAAR